jgi:hypothetical protein
MTTPTKKLPIHTIFRLILMAFRILRAIGLALSIPLFRARVLVVVRAFVRSRILRLLGKDVPVIVHPWSARPNRSAVLQPQPTRRRHPPRLRINAGPEKSRLN